MLLGFGCSIQDIKEKNTSLLKQAETCSYLERLENFRKGKEAPESGLTKSNGCAIFQNRTNVSPPFCRITKPRLTITQHIVGFTCKKT